MINKKEFQFDDYTISFKENCSEVTFQKKNNTNPIYFKYTNLNSGILFLDLQLFNGYMFFDKELNFYDTWHKKIYFNNGSTFIGDEDKEAFILFDNFILMEKKIEDGIDQIKNEPNDKEKKNIENNILKDLKSELENFDFNKIKLKNGKMTYSNSKKIHYIHENILKEINGTKIYEGKFIQEIKDKKIKLLFYGNVTDKDIEAEFFYGYAIGRGYMIDPNSNLRKNNWFYFDNDIFKEGLEEIDKKDNIIVYKLVNERITLTKSIKNRNNPVTILVKDIENKSIIYEINAKMAKENKLKGNGFVKDFRTGEILLVNFNTFKIISKNPLDELPLCLDREEFVMNRKRLFEDIDTKKRNYIKNKILKINEILNNGNQIEQLAKKINKIITESKINYLGTKDQKYSGECWVYSLSEIIYMANARKYGRELEDFGKIYSYIIDQNPKSGKIDDKIEIIMDKVLPYYGLCYKKVDDISILENFLKDGIKCLAIFDLNNKEWYNFSSYYNNKSIKENQKVLTKEILKRQIYKDIKEPDEIKVHALILSELDNDNNLIFVNSWGKNCGNKEKFKAKIDCFESATFFAIYWENQTKKEEDDWNELNGDIKELLKELKSIRCPKCKKSARIEYFDEDENKIGRLICPFQNKCKFNINDNISFIAYQLMSYDLDTNRDAKKKFIFGFE